MMGRVIRSASPFPSGWRAAAMLIAAPSPASDAAEAVAAYCTPQLERWISVPPLLGLLPSTGRAIPLDPEPGPRGGETAGGPEGCLVIDLHHAVDEVEVGRQGLGGRESMAKLVSTVLYGMTMTVVRTALRVN